jgi:hypothetical protein
VGGEVRQFHHQVPLHLYFGATTSPRSPPSLSPTPVKKSRITFLARSRRDHQVSPRNGGAPRHRADLDAIAGRCCSPPPMASIAGEAPRRGCARTCAQESFRHAELRLFSPDVPWSYPPRAEYLPYPSDSLRFSQLTQPSSFRGTPRGLHVKGAVDQHRSRHAHAGTIFLAPGIGASF